MRKSSGDLHFYINGLDQGVAATRLSQQLWGAVDLYGLTTKVCCDKIMESSFQSI